ncbi:MAG: symmetrical bis(5'-nucleosyl)-tetraphosphatase [Gammaproteobacteria bacterium]|nr:symmetrical bis(5'-nucleosyl)-tetraphosphatase [Gammaproteobacteria bacterium]
MGTYAIGDIQGCFKSLQSLLEKLAFNPKADELWCVGDVINRGPRSLETLRFLKSLNERVVCVLGNHDIHLLGRYYGVRDAHRHDTLDTLLSAPDIDELMEWLRHRPLFHWDQNRGIAMVHAGIGLEWSFEETAQYAREIEQGLQGPDPAAFLKFAFGNTPDRWSPTLCGHDRTRVIINILTRLRFCDANHHLNLTFKGTPTAAEKGLAPWFTLRDWKLEERLIFGHWAALNGETHDYPNLFALDTGCVWGNRLTAMNLDTLEKIAVPFLD